MHGPYIPLNSFINGAKIRVTGVEWTKSKCMSGRAQNALKTLESQRDAFWEGEGAKL